MRKGITIRNIGIEDLHEVFLFGSRTFAQSHNTGRLWGEKVLADLLADDMGLSFIAVMDKKIVGCIIGSEETARTGPKKAMIHWFGAEEGMQEHDSRIAELLLLTLKEEASKRDIHAIAAGIPSGNGQIMGVLKKFGFTESVRIHYMEKNF